MNTHFCCNMLWTFISAHDTHAYKSTCESNEAAHRYAKAFCSRLALLCTKLKKSMHVHNLAKKTKSCATSLDRKLAVILLSSAEFVCNCQPTRSMILATQTIWMVFLQKVPRNHSSCIHTRPIDNLRDGVCGTNMLFPVCPRNGQWQPHPLCIVVTPSNPTTMHKFNNTV